MPRPTNKAELLNLAEKNCTRLLELVTGIPDAELLDEFPKGTLNRKVTDVVAHLHEWHLMIMNWYNTGAKGVKPSIPAEGYTWKTLPALNRKIWMKYSQAQHAEIMKAFSDSHCSVMTLIEKHSDEELFEKKRYTWTGSTSLGAYLISATSSHYDWAVKLIKKCRKKMTTN
jgi:hypothetical protein